MSNRIKLSYNPKVQALVARVRPQLDAFERENPFLGRFILEVFNDRKVSYRMGYSGAEALVHLLKATGMDAVLRSPADVDAHPEAFWVLADAAKASGGDAAITGLLCLYHHFYRKKYLKETFKGAEKSPMPFIHTRSFATLMAKEYTCSDDLYFIGYSRHRHKATIVLPWANRDLRAMVVDAFIRWPNMYDRSSATLRLLYEAEAWFVDKGKDIHSFSDLTEDVLTTCIGSIMSMRKGKRRTTSMQFLFWIFSVQILDHPEHRFFEGSHLWTPGIVINRRIPIHLAAGYQFAIYGQTDEVRQDKGVLLIIKDGDLLSANGQKNEVYTIDLSDVTIPLYWRILANYAKGTTVMRVGGAKRFLMWLISDKKCTGMPYELVSKDELSRFRSNVSRMSLAGTARNKYINDTRKILRWASAAGYLAVDILALKDFVYFDYKNNPKPDPLCKEELRMLIATTEALGDGFDVRFKLLSCIVRILLSCEIRIGALVRMTLSDLNTNEKGEITYRNRIKKKGVDKHPIHLTKRTSDIIREAIALTDDIRKDCPAGMHDGCVFIYRNSSSSSVPFGVFTTNRVNQDLKRVSDKAGFEESVTTGRLRDTYMSAAERFARNHGFNDLQRAVLTKHANKLSTRSYVRLHLSDVLQAVQGVKIGNL